MLREAVGVEAGAGRESACVHVEQARLLAADSRDRGAFALEVAGAYAALFR